jgi:hypothetical protein
MACHDLLKMRFHVATHVHGRQTTMVYVGDDPSETGGNEDYIVGDLYC